MREHAWTAGKPSEASRGPRARSGGGGAGGRAQLAGRGRGPAAEGGACCGEAAGLGRGAGGQARRAGRWWGGEPGAGSRGRLSAPCRARSGHSRSRAAPRPASCEVAVLRPLPPLPSLPPSLSPPPPPPPPPAAPALAPPGPQPGRGADSRGGGSPAARRRPCLPQAPRLKGKAEPTGSPGRP